MLEGIGGYRDALGYISRRHWMVLGGIGEYCKVLEGIGGVSEVTGGNWIVLEGIVRCWRVLDGIGGAGRYREAIGKHWRVLVGIGGCWKALEGIDGGVARASFLLFVTLIHQEVVFPLVLG